MRAELAEPLHVEPNPGKTAGRKRRLNRGIDRWIRDVTDGIRMLLEKEKIYGYRFEGKRHDAGDKLGFLKATVEFALKRPELGEKFLAYLKELEL